MQVMSRCKNIEQYHSVYMRAVDYFVRQSQRHQLDYNNLCPGLNQPDERREDIDTFGDDRVPTTSNARSYEGRESSRYACNAEHDRRADLTDAPVTGYSWRKFLNNRKTSEREHSREREIPVIPRVNARGSKLQLSRNRNVSPPLPRKKRKRANYSSSRSRGKSRSVSNTTRRSRSCSNMRTSRYYPERRRCEDYSPEKDENHYYVVHHRRYVDFCKRIANRSEEERHYRKKSLRRNRNRRSCSPYSDYGSYCSKREKHRKEDHPQFRPTRVLNFGLHISRRDKFNEMEMKKRKSKSPNEKTYGFSSSDTVSPKTKKNYRPCIRNGKKRNKEINKKICKKNNFNEKKGEKISEERKRKIRRKMKSPLQQPLTHRNRKKNILNNRRSISSNRSEICRQPKKFNRQGISNDSGNDRIQSNICIYRKFNDFKRYRVFNNRFSRRGSYNHPVNCGKRNYYITHWNKSDREYNNHKKKSKFLNRWSISSNNDSSCDKSRSRSHDSYSGFHSVNNPSDYDNKRYAASRKRSRKNECTSFSHSHLEPKDGNYSEEHNNIKAEAAHDRVVKDRCVDIRSRDRVIRGNDSINSEYRNRRSDSRQRHSKSTKDDHRSTIDTARSQRVYDEDEIRYSDGLKPYSSLKREGVIARDIFSDNLSMGSSSGDIASDNRSARRVSPSTGNEVDRPTSSMRYADRDYSPYKERNEEANSHYKQMTRGHDKENRVKRELLGDAMCDSPSRIRHPVKGNLRGDGYYEEDKENLDLNTRRESEVDQDTEWRDYNKAIQRKSCNTDLEYRRERGPRPILEEVASKPPANQERRLFDGDLRSKCSRNIREEFNHDGDFPKCREEFNHDGDFAKKEFNCDIVERRKEFDRQGECVKRREGFNHDGDLVKRREEFNSELDFSKDDKVSSPTSCSDLRRVLQLKNSRRVTMLNRVSFLSDVDWCGEGHLEPEEIYNETQRKNPQYYKNVIIA